MLPEPMAKPSTIAITGFGRCLTSSMKSDSLVPEYSGLVLSSPWSLPEQKALGPEPEITTTLISESLPASSRASDISSVVRPRMALYTSGRLMVIQAIPSSF